MRLEQKPGGHSDGQNHCNCAHSCFHELPPGNTICGSRLLGSPFWFSVCAAIYTLRPPHRRFPSGSGKCFERSENCPHCEESLRWQEQESGSWGIAGCSFEALLESDALGYSLLALGYLQSDCVPDC